MDFEFRQKHRKKEREDYQFTECGARQVTGKREKTRKVLARGSEINQLGHCNPICRLPSHISQRRERERERGEHAKAEWTKESGKIFQACAYRGSGKAIRWPGDMMNDEATCWLKKMKSFRWRPLLRLPLGLALPYVLHFVSADGIVSLEFKILSSGKKNIIIIYLYNDYRKFNLSPFIILRGKLSLIFKFFLGILDFIEICFEY